MEHIVPSAVLLPIAPTVIQIPAPVGGIKDGLERHVGNASLCLDPALRRGKGSGDILGFGDSSGADAVHLLGGEKFSIHHSSRLRCCLRLLDDVLASSGEDNGVHMA